MVGSGQFFVARVSHLWFGFEFGKFTLTTSNFSIFFTSGQKNLFELGRKVPGSKAGWPLIYCGSKVSSVWAGQGPSLILIFSGRQKSARPISARPAAPRLRERKSIEAEIFSVEK